MTPTAPKGNHELIFGKATEMSKSASAAGLWLMAGLTPVAIPAAAFATMAVNKVIVDFLSGKPRRSDVELHNTGRERMYVLVEPAEIRAPGLPRQKRVKIRNPQRLGLLVTPTRLILEPGQRKIVRFAALAAGAATDRVFRVTIRPVVGKVVAPTTAIKIVVGYDLLVIIRPQHLKPHLTGRRKGRTITFRNTGNTNALLFNGRQCDQRGKNCKTLPVKRMYANTVWTLKLDHGTPAEYYVKVGETTVKKSF